MSSKNYQIKEVTKLPNAEAEITGEITLSFLVECRKEALKHLGEHVDIAGFRSGHIPEDILAKHVGEMRVLEESAEVALAREYPHILEEAKVNAISRPEVSITNLPAVSSAKAGLAPGVPLEFKIRVAVEPEFDLPDYKKIASEAKDGAKSEKLEVADDEVKAMMAEVENRGIRPELAEGENIEDKIKESLLAQKEIQAQEKRRLSIIEKLVEATQIDVPKPLVEQELARMLAQFKGDIERMGMKWTDYLKESKKTEGDIKEEWRDQAEKRVKAELIIAKIAQEEKIEPAEEELNAESEQLLSHYPDADPLRARIYIFTQLRNQKVFEFLESVK